MLAESVLGDPDRVEPQFLGQLRPSQDVLVDLDVGAAYRIGVDLALVGILLVEQRTLPHEKSSKLHGG